MKTGIQPFDLFTRHEPGPAPPAPLEDGDHQPGRGGDGEEVQCDRLQREQQRSEGAHEHQIGEAEDAEDQPGERAERA